MKTSTDIPDSPSMPPFESAHDWYVIHCKTGKEKSTTEMLRVNLGLVVYLPERRIWKKGRVCFIPLFPGYFFVQANLQETSLSRINTSPGVLRLLECENTPQTVPAHIVEALWAEITRLSGYHSHQDFRPGDTLHVVDGPLRGLESVFIGPMTPGKRVQVFLNFLGRLTKAEIEVSALEKRRENIKPEQVRSTRGKGRKIVSNQIRHAVAG